jgi:hypothetical protein
MYFFHFICNFYLKHFSFQEEETEIWSKMNNGIHVQYPFFLSDFNESSIFWADFQKILEYPILLKSV